MTNRQRLFALALVVAALVAAVAFLAPERPDNWNDEEALKRAMEDDWPHRR